MRTLLYEKLYLLGIWFDKIPETTLVWTANRDDPVDEGSTLELTPNGDLTLLDSHKDIKWSANKSTMEVTGAAMLDTGNFVLLDSSSEAVWQSFDSPTDTLLPGQTLRWKSMLVSKSNRNYSSGRFELELREDGEMLLYPVEIQSEPGSSGQGEYWNSQTGISGADNNTMNLNLDKDGFLSLVNIKNETVRILNQNTSNVSMQYYCRVTLDSDGVLREYVRGRDKTSSWSVVWRIIDDPCIGVKSSCGLNGYCSHVSGETTDAKPNCMCPPGFPFIDPEDPSRGCLRPASTINSCISSEMKELPNTNWPGGDYSILHRNESECTQACLKDCECIVVIFWNGYCWKKRLPLLAGKKGDDIGGSAFVRAWAIQPPLPPPLPKHRRQSRVLFVTGISLLGCSAIFLAAALMILGRSYALKRSFFKKKYKVPEGLTYYTYKEIYAATGAFKEQLGKGAFGTVYKGMLYDGTAIAVKKLEKLVNDGDKQFRTEMVTIGTTHHRNLVRLFGFCDENSHRLLVYEYMTKGSLDSVLFDKNCFLDWNLRVHIAIGTAKGIAYLHEECRTQIIHCDIKPQNILLDEDCNAKISDFGLAKLMATDQTRTFTATRGTRGYLSTEWQKNLPITVKVDVYSFGVMLLEIISCRKSVDLDVPDNQIVLSEWAYECLKFGRLQNLVQDQPSEDNAIDGRQLERMVLVALWCIQDDPCLRPSMKKVVQMLEGTVEIAFPPPLPSFINSVPDCPMF
eukprot:Gb_05509 [translate_table: standard]